MAELTLVILVTFGGLVSSWPQHKSGDDIQVESDHSCAKRLPPLDVLLEYDCKDILDVDYRRVVLNRSTPCCAMAKFRACAVEIYEEICGPIGPSFMTDELREIVNACPRYAYPSVVCYVYYYDELLAWVLLMTCVVLVCHCCYRACCAAPKRKLNPIVSDNRPRNGTTATLVEYI